MTTLNDFQQEHPVTVIHLYRPDPKDWFRDVMVYLNRVNDCRRRVVVIRSRAELLDSIADPDEDLITYCARLTHEKGILQRMKNRSSFRHRNERELNRLRDQHPLLTEAIKKTRDNAMPYDYSNEAEMLNRIVLGMTAKQYREKHGIPKSEPIRPSMTLEEATLMERLQVIDVGLQYSEPDYQKRKQTLEWYAMSQKQKAKLPELDESAA